MRALGRWFQKQAKRQGKIVLIEDALLSGHFVAYGFYRLRYFFGRNLVAATLHLVEFLFLSYIFSDLELISALLVRSATTFASAFWWGGLEVMRQRIRELRSELRPHHIPDTVAHWIATASIYSVVVVVLTCLWAFLDASRVGTTFTLFHLYVLANGLRLAFSLVTRTFHSGVYALRRVYRPLWSIVGVDLSAFLGTLLLWPVMGPWSFPTLLMLSTATSSTITLVFTARAYRLLGLYPEELAIDYRSAVSRVFDSFFALAGLSYALMKLDTVVLFVLCYGAYHGNSELFFVFYLITPFVRASSDWAQLFYFDLKRLELDLLAKFNGDFERFVGQLALVVGLLFWALASLGATLMLQRNLGAVYLALAAFFIVRSRLGFYQIRAFAQRQYLRLLLAGLLLIIAAVVIGFVLEGGIERKVIYLALVLLSVVLYLQRRARRAAQPEPVILAAQDWLARLAREDSPLDLHGIRMDRETTDFLVRQVAIAIARRVGRAGAVTVAVNRRIVWFDRRSDSREMDENWLHRRGGGLIDWASDIPGCASGVDAIHRLREEKLLGRELHDERPSDPSPLTEGDLKERFLSLLPRGLIFEPGKPPSASAAKMTRADRQDVMRSAIRYSRNLFAPRGRSKYDVTTFCTDGSMQLVFVADRTDSRVKRRRWKRLIETVNLNSAIRSIGVGGGSRRQAMRYRRVVGWAVVSISVFLFLAFVDRDDREVGRFELRLADRSEIRAPAAGFLRDCRFDEGDRVTAGEPICRLEIPDLASRVAGQRQEAQSLRKILQRIRGRGEEARAADWARLAGLEEAVRYLEQVQESLVLESSVDGVITTAGLRQSVGRYYREGELICVVQEPSSLEAEIVLPEKRIERVRQGDRVELKALALPYRTFHGAVNRVAPAAVPAVDLGQSTVTAYCRLEENASGLRPGMTGYARIVIGRRSIGSILIDRISRFVRTEFWW